MVKIVKIQNEEDRIPLLEQYKMLAESINKIHEVRENSNNWWVGVNGGLVGAISYFRNVEGLEGPQKQVFLWTIIILGFILCYTWLSSILTIKRSIDVRNSMLVDLERYLSARIVTFSLYSGGKEKDSASLSLKEAVVPILFLAGYGFFAVMLYFYPHLNPTS